ncbi:hypothetical protein PR202_ga15620 [Eleusine coracana subsp. coracana]|uniref:Alpha/beta hydrolase fold-3 domain-containing protein n=1 Tax=Eleusine coracana subsp. coracana TaxID=191504 RepID=A0AAV5CK53_ELECO|nr:hypothetical protein QOZ80_6BG0491000 [Eleusine coracana subsp. coracana]GJM98595.1 hypothetical protein PR202_ga15620 [Eleusine coracana subsp. coracana]
MEPGADEVAAFDYAPEHFRIYKSGMIDCFNRQLLVTRGVNDATGVAFKDVVLDAGTGLSVRLFLPNLQEQHPKKKLPVLLYFHGGGFITKWSFSGTYHNYVFSLPAAAGVLAMTVDCRHHDYLASLAATAGVLAVFVGYRRLAFDFQHPLPAAAYDDCWAALRWAVSSARDDDEWVRAHGDTARVFVAGDKAGGNIVRNLLARAAADEGALRIEGAILLHACSDDSRFNPELEHLGCKRMLVCAAEDCPAPRVRAYHGAAAASACQENAAWMDTEREEEHMFFLLHPEGDRAKKLMDRVVAFIAAA